MKRIAIFALLLVSVLALNCYADEFSVQISALEQKADRVQSQINQAKQQSDQVLDQQMRQMTASVESLINQRVQLDSHIAKLENQIDEMKKTSATNLSRQIKNYDEELSTVKQQISSLVAAKKAAQKATDTVAPVTPAPGN